MSGRTRVTIVGTAVLLTAAKLHAAPPGDAPQTIPGWRLPQAALDALWNALAWLLILPS